MNKWLWAAFAMLLGMVPCGYLCFFKRDAMDRLVGLQMASMIESIILLLLAQGFNRSVLYDISLCLVMLTFGGGLVFIRFLERWE